MTQQKKLKKIIRERMRKTGERYAAARRQVLARELQSVRVATLKLKTGKQSVHFPGNIPAVTALRILLAGKSALTSFGDKPLDESMLFGIAGGIGIGVFAFHYESEPFSSLYLAGRHDWWDDLTYLKNVLERLGGKPVVREAGGKKAAEKNLREMLEKCGPVIAWVDAAGLPYRALPRSWEGGGYHILVVHDIDESRQAVLVSDQTDEVIELPLEILSNARSRIKKFKNRLLALESDFSPEQNASQLIVNGIRACCDGFKNARSINFKPEALLELSKRMRGDNSKQSWDRVFPRGPLLWSGLTFMYDFIEHYGTGGGLCRPIFARFLNDSAKILKDERLKVLAKQYDEIGQKWSDLAEHALPSEVPEFRKAKKLYTEKTELFLSEGAHATAKVAAKWREIGELAGTVGRSFPLSETEVRQLRADLSEEVADLYKMEAETLQDLQAFPT